MVVSQSTNKGEDNLVSCAELLIEAGGNINDHDKYAIIIWITVIVVILIF